MFTVEHQVVIQEMLNKLASPGVLTFPDYRGAISGERPFRLVTDASKDCSGAVLEELQEDCTVRPLLICVDFSRQSRGEVLWNWSVERMCRLLKSIAQYFIGFSVRNLQRSPAPLKNLAHLAGNNDRMQR